ncbi:hypothetical protein [Lewinella sp. W8]|uniref:hypothetical protein n=1 Tax=Lewinella sp. W8 TaxID=2528208 RepID=UPI0010680450|nr:hypothetical protein [Lewinella sp. W8]MTB50881.1 hypothetical protein [Lewinella sp. W8]
MQYTTSCRLFGLLVIGLLFTQCADFRPHELPIEGLTSEAPPTGKLEYSTFMVGDLGYDYDRGLTTLEAMVKAMPEGKKKSSLLLLGDITGPDGLRKKGGAERVHLEAIGKRLSRVPGKVYYTPGENELGRAGNFSRLKRLEEFFEEEIDKKVEFMPNRACSGPDDEEIFDRVGLIGVSTAWYLADWSQDEEVSEGCDYRDRRSMLFAVADEIKGYRDQVKIVMMHHPLQSSGNRGGQFSFAQHIFPLADVIPGAYVPLPVVGSIVRGVQSSGGGSQDVNSLLYQEFVNRVKMGIDDEANVIFVSAHEQNMMVAHEKNYIQVVAGSGSVRGPAKGGNDANFTYGAIGFSRLDFYDDGTVYIGFYSVDKNGDTRTVFYRRIIEDRFEPQDEGIEEAPSEPIDGQVVKASIYGTEVQDKSSLYKGTFGKHYRPLYYTPVEVPVLKIDTINGGLNPYRRGGGMTTMSLHTEGGDGRLYQLRSVRKNPAQLLPSILERSFAADLAKDQFTAIHPYAPLALPPMQQKLGLFGADPLLYYIPKQNALGQYNTNFGGEMYWLEQRPDEDWSGTRFFGGSKDIISNSAMREELTKSWKTYADQNNYARARLFDLWIGDWDRHRDQWRWAAFEEEDGRTRYVAVARDRDQVFSDFDGALIGLARVFVPEARKLRPFDERMDKARWRAMNGKWNDRLFLNRITREEMLAEARFIQGTLTEDLIDQSLNLMPPEVREYSLREERIGDKLKVRLTQLEDFAEEYYEFLAREVTVLGTDKDDVIMLEGKEDGTLSVRLYDADKEGEADELFYDRTFRKRETREVRIYGLDGDDRFVVKGEQVPIKIRLIGGTDGDKIESMGKLRVLAHDEKEGMEIEGAKSRVADRRSDNHPELNQYDFEEFYPNYTTPIPSLGFNVDDGFFIGAGFTRTISGFKPDPYAQRHTFLASYSTNEFYKLQYDGEFNNAFGRYSDLTAETYYYSPGYVANFFGIGNDAPGQPEEGDELGLADDQILEYNRARREEFYVNPMLRFRGKRNRFAFSVGPFYHSLELDDDTPDFALILNTDGIPDRVFDEQRFGGFAAHLSSNNLANPLIADQGLSYDFYARQTWNLQNEDLSTFKYGGQVSIYRMLTKAINLATRIGFEHNTGTPEFYQLTSMGGRTNYRAARSERYRGNTMFFQNIDLRFMGFQFGKNEAPTVAGFILGMDYGRVWLDGEDSDTWHIGYGGGLWMAPLGATIIHLTYFTDNDDARISFGAGFPF